LPEFVGSLSEVLVEHSELPYFGVYSWPEFVGSLPEVLVEHSELPYFGV
jgi:hypothetical protein